MSKEKFAIHKSSGNIFADLGFKNAEEHMLKAQITAALHGLVADRGLTQTAAADLMGITQPEVSRLFKGHFREYSVDRLINFLTAFDQDVEIVVKPHKTAGKKNKPKRGQITFRSAA